MGRLYYQLRTANWISITRIELEQNLQFIAKQGVKKARLIKRSGNRRDNALILA